ncbi:MAG: hypothetical protein MH112_00040 [Phenylobacterium sp.]|uniref:hypothetical protein n=1 Tax=Phenylobacterium sp. TaxID=1871053 RepID=UPI0025CE56D1|nr:hypothetical protein [Phenylobacterium sp.]MCG9914734.1 hypothetical protein [Phenylobacterium sp.]
MSAALASLIWRSDTRLQAALGLAWLSTAVSFTASLNNGLPTIEVAKAALGMGLFLTALIFLPQKIAHLRAYPAPTLEILAILICLAFILEKFQVFSMKEIGLVDWFETRNYTANFDTRPSGLYSEPSWMALSLIGLSVAMLGKPGRFKPFAIAISLFCAAWCGSSIGLLMAALVTSWIVVNAPIPVHRREVRALVKVVSVFGVILASLAVFPFIDADQARKILMPFDYGSGVSRFLRPIPYLQDVLARTPFFGQGLSYMTERLLGLTGLAVLPVNVMLDTGLFGVAVYGIFIATTLVKMRASAFSCLLVMILLLSLGMQYSPWQAILIVMISSMSRPSEQVRAYRAAHRG